MSARSKIDFQAAQGLAQGFGVATFLQALTPNFFRFVALVELLQHLAHVGCNFGV